MKTNIQENPLRGHNLKRHLESYGNSADGIRNFVNEIATPAIMGGALPNGDVVKEENRIDPWSVSIRELWEEFVGPLSMTMPSKRDVVANMTRNKLKEDVGTQAFATITGQFVFRMLIDGYNAPGFIGDELVTTMSSNTRVERIPGMTSGEGPDELSELEPYKEASMGEKFVTSEAFKKGKIISVSEEMVTEDKTGQILQRAQDIGEATRQERDKVIIEVVTGENANAFQPAGVPTTLYSVGNNNLLASTPLVDWTSIDDALTHHATNITDDREGDPALQEPIVWMPDTILVPTSLQTTALRILNATEVRAVSNTDNTTLSANPMAGRFRVISSPLVDSVLSAADTWYIGEFRRQFVWHEIWPLQTFQQGATSDSAFQRDAVARFKVRYYGGAAAKDFRRVVQVNVA